MADSKISDLTADATPTSDDLIVTVNDPGGSPANRKVTIANLLKVVNGLSSVTPATEDVALLIDDPSGTPVAKKATLAAISKAIEHAFQSHGNTGTTETIDVANGVWHAVTLDDNCTFTFTSPASGSDYSFILEVTEDGTGGRTVAWPGSVAWPGGVTPAHDTTAGTTTIYGFMTRDGGTTWYGVQLGGDPTTTRGDLLVRGASALTRLGIGAAAKFLRSDGTDPSYQYPPGHEFDYAEFTSDVTVSATTEAGANTVVTGNAVTYDGATIVMIEFFSPHVDPQTTAGANIWIVLYDGAASVGHWGLAQTPANATTRVPVYLRRRLTPSAASHTYSARAYRGTANGGIAAGAGGNGAVMPGFIRITKAT